MNAPARIQTEFLELTLTPYTVTHPTADPELSVVPEGRGLYLMVDAPNATGFMERPVSLVLLTLPGARSIAKALRQAVEAAAAEDIGSHVAEDQFVTCVAEFTGRDHDILITFSGRTARHGAPRGLTLGFSLEALDASRLADLLDQTALMADPAGGAA